MTKENNELLLKDLCARLPYNVICQVEFKENGKYESKNMILSGIFKDEAYFTIENGSVYSNDYKPYLFPLSSMTEEQEKESFFEPSLLNAFINGYISLFEDEELNIDDLNRLYDWLNKNHFDYRGLIEKGLAIDATNLNIY